MIFLPTLFQPPTPGVDIAALTTYALQRNIQKLDGFLDAESLKSDPFSIVATGGPYFGPIYPWTPVPLQLPGTARRFIVFSSRISVEDVGELLFEVRDGKLHYLPEDDPLGARFYHHDFTIRFDRPKHEAMISDAVTAERFGEGHLSFFRMGPNFHVDGIQVDGKAVSWRQAGGITALDLPKGHSKLFITYHGFANDPRFEGFIVPQEAMLTNSMWYPNIARLPTDYDAAIVAPKGWTAVAQGELISHKQMKDEGVWRYHMSVPCCYFSLSEGPYKTAVMHKDGRELRVWSDVLTPSQMVDQAEFMAPIIQFYSQTFSTFPFSGYGAMVSSRYRNDWLEAYSFASYTAGGLPTEDPHEPSHTWWGGILPNTYLHSLWNESFADYSQTLYDRFVPIGNPAQRALAFIPHLACPPDGGHSVIDSGVFSGPVAASLGYTKGAGVLSMLENELGVPMMLKCMRRFISDHQPYEPSEWEGFEKAVNEETGEDYGWFFKQWLARPGYLEYTVTDSKLEHGTLTAIIHFTGEPYQFRLPLMLDYANGRTVMSSVEIPAAQGAVIHVPVEGSPSEVIYDPYQTLLSPYATPFPQPLELRAPETRTFVEAGEAVARLKGRTITKLPGDLDAALLVCRPGSFPAIDAAARKAGFAVSRGHITYGSETVGVGQGAAVFRAVINHGQPCTIIYGHVKYLPKVGSAAIALVDELGRFLGGQTLPLRVGPFVQRLG